MTGLGSIGSEKKKREDLFHVILSNSQKSDESRKNPKGIYWLIIYCIIMGKDTRTFVVDLHENCSQILIETRAAILHSPGHVIVAMIGTMIIM